MIVSGYTMDVYCENQETVSHVGFSAGRDCSFYGETKAECVREAKARGWKLDVKRGLALCPACKKNGLKFPEDTP